VLTCRQSVLWAVPGSVAWGGVQDYSARDSDQALQPANKP